MDNSARWIWYHNDFEIYHSMLVHDRREQYDFIHPSMWRLPRPECICRFIKRVSVPYETQFKVEVKGKGLVRIDGGPSRSPNATHTLTPGDHTVTVEVQNVSAFPALYIDHPLLKTDETWTADCLDACERPVGCEPAFERASDDLTVFPFCYEPIEPVSEEHLNDGILYDFGKETFGPVSLHQHLDHGSIRLCYGETREEALDYEYAVARETLPAYEGKNRRPPRAFRYLFVQAEGGAPEISAQLEYLPIEDVADFKTEDALVNKIWRICSDTVHHCCREFYVDGIKRDRWVWSLDAYVSFRIAQYLFDDPAIARRTIRALLGKPPYTQHINTINEYSSYLIILLFEYYQTTEDLSFVKSNWPEICSLYAFIQSRLNEDGYVVKRAGDWLFIDWTEMDKTDPVCVEQIILWQTHKIMGQLCQILGEDGTECFRAADCLQKKIIRDYYDPQNHILISSFKDSVPYITRHAAIMAILYDFFDEETSLKLKQAVLMNDSIAPITTPVWKFLELMALGKFGEIRQIQEYILSYWGGMIKQGATSIWEEYDPTGTESSIYYGLPHRLSLCHFWGGGPITLLGKYCAGVSATSVGGKTFDVAPQPGLYNQFVAKVPMNHGVVTVEYENHTVRVSSTVPGGTLRFAGKACVIPSDGSSVSLSE